MYVVATLGVLATMGLALVRAARGPTVWDRVLAVNTMGTMTVLLIAVLGFLTGRPEWLDLAVLKFAKYGDLSQGSGGKS